jgi:hypothetical protein
LKKNPKLKKNSKLKKKPEVEEEVEAEEETEAEDENEAEELFSEFKTDEDISEDIPSNNNSTIRTRDISDSDVDELLRLFSDETDDDF